MLDPNHRQWACERQGGACVICRTPGRYAALTRLKDAHVSERQRQGESFIDFSDALIRPFNAEDLWLTLMEEEGEEYADALVDTMHLRIAQAMKTPVTGYGKAKEAHAERLRRYAADRERLRDNRTIAIAERSAESARRSAWATGFAALATFGSLLHSCTASGG